MWNLQKAVPLTRPGLLCKTCATGTHRPATREELIRILGRDVVERFRIVQNNCTADEQYLEVGRSSSGNRVRLNKEMMDCDLRILTGFIEPHFFAGFSGR